MARSKPRCKREIACVHECGAALALMAMRALAAMRITAAMTLALALATVLALGMLKPQLAFADECPVGGDHDFTAAIITPATEDADGVREFTCAKCGYRYQQAIPRTGHHWGPWIVEVEPTCTSEGYRYRVCQHYTGDVHYDEEVLQALSPTGTHTWVEAARAEATCLSPGQVTYACSVCGEQATAELPALGHTWGVWELVREATAQRPGEEQRVCLNDPAHVESRAVSYAAPASEGPDVEEPVGAEEPPVANADDDEVTMRRSMGTWVYRNARDTDDSGDQDTDDPDADPNEPDFLAAQFTPNTLDGVMAGLDIAAVLAFLALAAPLIADGRWIAAKRALARRRFLGTLEDGEHR